MRGSPRLGHQKNELVSGRRVDHSRLSADLGGDDACRAMAERFHRRHLGVVVDIVPNHMARPTPETRNKQLWSVLYQGQASPYAHWFDIDWAAQAGQLLMPILAGPLEKCLGDLIIDTAPKTPEHAEHRGPVLRYFDHVLPLRDGVADLPLGMLLAEQHFLLADWHDAATQLNYRRFFDIDTLIAVRVEDPDVFEVTHANMTVTDKPSPLLPGYSASLADLIELAITRSDNVATNMLYDVAGRERATAICRERFGLRDTAFRRKLSGDYPLIFDPQWDGTNMNRHSVRDAARLFELIARDRVPLADVMRRTLARQEWNNKLSPGLQAGDAFDHKAAEGFIGVFGLPLRNQSRIQALWGPDSEATLAIPRNVASAKPVLS